MEHRIAVADQRQVSAASLTDVLATLEDLPDLLATRKEWAMRCGEGFGLMEPLLRPAGGIAQSMPCDRSHMGLHYHDVVEFLDGETLAVYPDEYYDCPSFPVERWERAVLTPDVDRLAELVCNVLGVERVVTERPGGISLDSYPVLEIGRYHPLESFQFPVVLSLHPDVVSTEEALLLCFAVYDGPFIFLTTTPKRAFSRTGPVISKRRVLVSSLQQCLEVGGDNSLVQSPHWRRSLSYFHRQVVPRFEPVMVFFETPTGTTWEGISIRFIDGHTVLVEAAGVVRRLSYTEMGMANRRESKPSKQWEFLEQIAGNHGVIDFDMGDSRKNKSWKYELSSDLRQFFHIANDPFVYDPQTCCWQARFQISM